MKNYLILIAIFASIGLFSSCNEKESTTPVIPDYSNELTQNQDLEACNMHFEGTGPGKPTRESSIEESIKKLEEAIAKLEEYLKEHPDEQAQEWLNQAKEELEAAKKSLEEGNKREAFKHLNKANRLFGAAFTKAHFPERVKEAITNLENAINKAEEYLKEHPNEKGQEAVNNAKELLEQAKEAYENGDYKNAMELVSKAHRLIAGIIRSIRYIESVGKQIENIGNELTRLSEYLSENPDEKAQKLYEEAKGAYEKAKEAYENGDYDTAQRYLNMAREFIREAHKILRIKELPCNSLEKLQTTVERLGNWMKEHPDLVSERAKEVYDSLVSILEELKKACEEGNDEKALELFRQATSLLEKLHRLLPGFDRPGKNDERPYPGNHRGGKP